MPKIHGDLEYQASTRAVLSGTGTALLPGITFSGDLNTGIYRPAADQLGFSTGGNVRLIINDEGALVISDTSAPGTTTNKLYAVSGNLYWNGVQVDAGGSYLSNVVEDTTPQLGGNLDVNGFDIVTTNSNILDITGYFNTGGLGGGVAVTGGASTTSTGGSASVAGGQGTSGAAAVLRGGTGTSASGGQAQLAGGNGPTGGGRVRIQVGRDTTDGSADGWLDFEKPSGLTSPVFRFHEAGTNGTNYIGLKSPTILGSDITYTLPTAPGVTGYVLSSSTGGTMSWTAPGLQNIVEDLSPQLGASLDTNGKYVKFDDNTGINDHLNNEQLIFREVVTPVNFFEMTQGITGEAVILAATGDDTDVDLAINPKNDGNLVLDGLSWPNADGITNQILVTDGAGTLSWADPGAATTQSNIYTATSGQTTFTGTDDNGDGFSYIVGALDVHLNGALLVSGTDYTATNGTSVVLTVGATTDDILQTTSYQGAMGTSTPEFVYTATASQTTFTGTDDNAQTLAYTAGEVYVYRNGVLLLDGTDYTATNGTSVVLTVPATLNDTVQIVAPVVFTVSSAYTKAESDALYMTELLDDTTPQLAANLDANGFNIGFDDNTGILDDSGNETLILRKQASAVNYVEILNAPTTQEPIIRASGSDANVNIQIIGKGTGQVKLAGEKWPTGTGSEGQALIDDGTGSLEWSDNHRKNAIINGNFNVWQRGTTHTNVGLADWTADRIQMLAQTGGKFDVIQNADHPLNAGSFCMKIDVNTADASLAAADSYGFQTKIEGYDYQRLHQNLCTMSFWVKSNVTGQYYISLTNEGGPPSHSYVAGYTISASNTWEKKTITFTPGTVGTFNMTSGEGLRVRWSLGDGSTSQTGTEDAWQAGNYRAGTSGVNFMASTSNEFRLTDIQIEVGGVATPFEQRSFAEELALCQRYYEKSYPHATVPGTPWGNGTCWIYNTGFASASLAAGISQQFSTAKRDVPTITMYSNATGASGKVRDNIATAADVTVTTANANENGFRWYATTSASKTAVSFTGHWVADAEL